MFNKTLIWLYWSRMNRREHSHLDAEERTLRILVDFILTKRDPPKSRSDPSFLSEDRSPAGLCRPRFSFFNLQFSKNRHRRRGVVALIAFGSGPAECRSRGSLDFVQLRDP